MSAKREESRSRRRRTHCLGGEKFHPCSPYNIYACNHGFICGHHWTRHKREKHPTWKGLPGYIVGVGVPSEG